MGVYTRPDSPYFWLYLETTKQKERTKILIGETAAQRHEGRRLADQRYYQRMNELAARLYKLPSAQPAIRFDKYAAAYLADVISQHKGREREAEMVTILIRELGAELLSAIDQDRVRTYRRIRRATIAASTANREVALLKAMLRDAVPKYIQVSPLVGMKSLPVVTPKRRIMTADEERRLLAIADPVERALLIVAVDGLIRMGDLLDLQRTDHKGDWLYVGDPKGGHPYEVALTARAKKALAAIPGDDRYFFQRYRRLKNEKGRRGAVRQALMRLCRDAGVPYGKKNHGITFHWATRRTGATRLVVDRHASIPAVQRQGNWKTADVLLSIYAEADREAQRDAILPSRSRSRAKGR